MSGQPVYQVVFLPGALRAWKSLDNGVREQARKVLLRRQTDPRIPSAALRGIPDGYKVKLRTVGYRVVYQVDDDARVLRVIAVGHRGTVYDEAIRQVV